MKVSLGALPNTDEAGNILGEGLKIAFDKKLTKGILPILIPLVSLRISTNSNRAVLTWKVNVCPC